MKSHYLKKIIPLLLVVCIMLAVMPTASGANLELTAEEDAKAVIPVTDSFLTSSGCQIGRYIDTVAFEEKNHVSRLKADEDVNTYVFLNEDNTKTVYYMDEAVKFVDDDGYIREKNIDLTYHVTGFSTAQNDVGLEIPTLPSSGISLSLDENQIKLYPLNGYPLSAAIRNGNSVDYPYFYGLGTTLRYSPTLSGVKEDIILSSYNGVHEFSFRVTTGGLNLYQVANRYYLAETEDADTKFWLGCVEIFDANTKPGYGTMTAQTVEAGQEYILTISADPAFLTDPNTNYPVTIDPTIYSENLNGVNTIEDAPIYEGYPDSNFGTYQYNRAGYADSSFKIGRTVVRLNGLMSDSNFVTAAVINSVKFYVADASGSAPAWVKLHPLVTNSSWTESNITWNTQGEYSTNSSLSSSAYIGNGNFPYFNITMLVKEWRKKSDDNFDYDLGFILKAENESSGDRALYSAEHSTSSKRPYVVADYTYFARSGSELPYHPECWNVNGIQDNTNCYSYALNIYKHWLNIGGLYGEDLTYDETDTTSQELNDAVGFDLDTYCYLTDPETNTQVKMWCQIPNANKYDAPPEGTYKIAACLNNSNGWHFFRQNADGSWSQKDYEEPVTNRDGIGDNYGQGNIIYNPETCDTSYNSYFVYFYVMPYPISRCSLHSHTCTCGQANNSVCMNFCPYICN